MDKKLIAFIGIGGALGATARYAVALIPMMDGFPLPTLLVNWLGCFLLAYISNQIYFKKMISKRIMTALTTGFIGSFTTFSTITAETVVLGNDSIISAITYVLLTVIGGLIFCYIGFRTAQRKVET